MSDHKVVANWNLIEEMRTRRMNKNNNQSWIQTFSGRKFKPLDPHIDSIVIQDIAHSLSRICRFNGHVKTDHYSVAQHSVLVSLNCDPEDSFYGLLHDASEFALGDFSSPLKRSGEFENYKKYEYQLQSMIYKRFELDIVEPESVKVADLRMLATEARDLMAPLHSDWIMPAEPYAFKIDPLFPKEAEKLFLDRFNELFLKHIKNTQAQ